jgi:hypothetical protein
MNTFSDDELQIDEETVEDLQPSEEQTDSVGGGQHASAATCLTPAVHEID